MPLSRCSEQSRETLEQYYIDTVGEDSSMRQVLKLLDETFLETTLYGLTSAATLVLLPTNTSKNPWYVMISGYGGEYQIRYLIPRNKQPWPNVLVKESVRSLEDLKKLIIIAIVESNGWTENRELLKLYEEL